MNTYPLTNANRKCEETIINDILKNNGYQQQPITQPPKKHKTHKAKTKWATFTYSGPEARTITNLFRNTNIKIPYKITNTIRHLLKPKNPLADIYNMSGIYQLQCRECPLIYVGQTGCTFKARYREHINAIKTNNTKSLHSIYLKPHIHMTQ
jgi:hypothetical protein